MGIDEFSQVAIRPGIAQLSRRGFLTAGASLGGGLLIGFGLATQNGPSQAAEARADSPFTPDAFIRIDPNGQITLTMAFVEVGQGVYTSVPMLIAEELEVELHDVLLEHAPPDNNRYANPLLGFQATGGSTTIRATYEPMRRAGATARIMLVQAAAQRWGVPADSCSADKGVVFHKPSGRKLGYGALAADAARLSVPAQITLKPRSEFKLIGTSQRRLDTPAKVNGSAVYGIDVMVPGMMFATLQQAPAYGGRVRSVDDSKARAVKGVLQIVRLDDCVAVIADHTGAARKGLAALAIEWDDGPNAQLVTGDIVGAMESASRGSAVRVRATGDFDSALAGSETKIDSVYQVPFLAHAAMEPMNCTVYVQPDRCEVWLGTQVIARAQDAAVKVTGLPVDKVTVHNHLIGGTFGRRLEADGVARAVQIAQQVRGPVKVIWSREEDIRRDMFRPYFYDRLRGGLDAQGQVVAWADRITGSSIIKRFAPPGFKDGFDGDTVEGAATTVYDLPTVLVEYVNHEPPQIPTAFWRGVGPTHNIFVVESFVDELAYAAKKDPAAFRLDLLDKNPRAKAVLALAMEKSQWPRKLGAGKGRGVAIQFSFGTYMAQVAEVDVAGDGTVTVERVVCALDCGAVVNPDTVEAQMQSAVIFGLGAALFQEITFKGGRVEQSNFHDVRPLRINEIPKIEIHVIASSEAPGGLGEPGTSGIAPALTNAVFAATGTRIRKLPVGNQAKKA